MTSGGSAARSTSGAARGGRCGHTGRTVNETPSGVDGISFTVRPLGNLDCRILFLRPGSQYAAKAKRVAPASAPVTPPVRSAAHTDYLASIDFQMGRPALARFGPALSGPINSSCRAVSGVVPHYGLNPALRPLFRASPARWHDWSIVLWPAHRAWPTRREGRQQHRQVGAAPPRRQPCAPRLKEVGREGQRPA